MQVVLDKGERDDWFGSHFILYMTIFCATALIAVIFWEQASHHRSPSGKNNDAFGLINLARNIGGGVGMSVVATLLLRRTQLHQSNLSARIHSGNGTFAAMIASATRMFMARGSSAFEASRQAYGLVAARINQQATMLAYLDNFWMLGVGVLLMIPFVFLMRKSKPGGPVAVH